MKCRLIYFTIKNYCHALTKNCNLFHEYNSEEYKYCLFFCIDIAFSFGAKRNFTILFVFLKLAK